MTGKSKKKVTIAKQKQRKSVTKSRAKYRCDPNLKKIIDLVNSIPPERKLPHHRELIEIRRDEQIADVARELIREVPNWFFGSRAAVVSDYVRFRELRQNFHYIAQMATLPDDRLNDYRRAVVADPDTWDSFQASIESKDLLPVELWRDWSTEDYRDSGGYLINPRLAFDLVIDDNGLISIAGGNLFLVTLVSKEAARIRECKICHRIFWAERNDAWTCSKRCGTTRRQRLSRLYQ